MNKSLQQQTLAKLEFLSFLAELKSMLKIEDARIWPEIRTISISPQDFFIDPTVNINIKRIT